jgi:hypothetical protein
MWIVSRHGFFSVVKKPSCAPDELEVRARCKRDLERLKEITGIKARILENAGTDYLFRIRMKREIWAKFLADEAMSIDYPNFKDEVLFGKSETPRRRKQRHDVYLAVWKALLSLSNTPGKMQRYNRSGLEDTLEDDQDLIDGAGPDSSLGLPGTKAPGRKPSFRFIKSKSWGK